MPLMKLENEPKNLASGTNHKIHIETRTKLIVKEEGYETKQKSK